MDWLTYFPLPYRVLALINLGIIYYYLLITITSKLRINALRILHLEKDYASYEILSTSVLQFSKAVTLVTILSWINYALCIWQNNYSYSFYFELVPLLTIILILYLILSQGSNRIFLTLLRTLKGRLDTKALRINDILFSDSLTSYSKIILDFANYLTYIIRGPETKLDKSGLDLVILSLPQLIRLSQCWYEWTLSKRRNRQAFLNFLKYSTNVFPLIMIYITRSYKSSTGDVAALSSSYLLGIEQFLIFVNSMYTFIWDIFVDWDYKLVIGTESYRKNFKYKLFFNLSIAFDFSLRFVWLWKFIFTNFYYFHDSSPQFKLFIMQGLEVTRRFLWCIHRLNTETIKDNGSDIELDKF